MSSTIDEHVRRIADDRVSGATALVLAGIEVLLAAPRDRTQLLEVAERLQRAQPLMAGFLTLRALLERSKDPASDLEMMARRIRRAPSAIARLAVPLIRLRPADSHPLRVITCSRSQIVETTLVALAAEEPLQVRCAESRPGGEGSGLARALADRGIDARLYEDTAIGTTVPGADAVVVGADAVSSRGFINKAGTAGLAALARFHGVPVYVLTGRERVIPAEVFDALPVEPPLTADGLQTPVSVVFERIPARFTDQLVTDAGSGIMEDNNMSS